METDLIEGTRRAFLSVGGWKAIKNQKNRGWTVCRGMAKTIREFLDSTPTAVLWRWAFWWLSRRVAAQVAEELCQELFLRLLKASQTPIDKPVPYLITSLRNVLADHRLRKLSMRATLETCISELPEVEDLNDPAENAAAGEALVRAVERMPDATWRDVFIDTELKGESVAYVATKYRKTEATIRSYRSRARAWVRQYIRSKGEHHHE